jgi:ubiquinone/menaquinone biosynthesis C-methylase UbiE
MNNSNEPKNEVINASQSKWNQLAKENIYKAIWCSRGEVNSDWDEAAIECLEVILKDIPIQKKWKVLDLGCGIGRLTKLMASQCEEITGVDFSPEMIEQAKMYLASISNVKLFVNNGIDLSLFEDGSFDFVYSMITLQHIPSLSVIENYILEIARVLKPSGYAKLQTCEGNSFELGNISETLYHGHLSKQRFENMFHTVNFPTVTVEMSILRHDWIWITAQK